MNTTEMIAMPTKRCYHCGEFGEIEMGRDEYARGVAMRDAGHFVQDAFPHLSADLREQIISGTHPECWKEMFGDDDENEEAELEYEQHDDPLFDEFTERNF